MAKMFDISVGAALPPGPGRVSSKCQWKYVLYRGVVGEQMARPRMTARQKEAGERWKNAPDRSGETICGLLETGKVGGEGARLKHRATLWTFSSAFLAVAEHFRRATSPCG